MVKYILLCTELRYKQLHFFKKTPFLLLITDVMKKVYFKKEKSKLLMNLFLFIDMFVNFLLLIYNKLDV